MPEKQTASQNRIRETLGRLYEHQPPHFREYIRRYQEDPTSRVFAPLAEAYRRLGRLDEAIDICLEGLKHHPEFPGGRVSLARCFFDKKKYVAAKEQLEMVVHISSDNILAQRLLGDCFVELQENEQALHCYKIAVALSPEDVALEDKIHRMQLHQNRQGTAPREPLSVSIPNVIKPEPKGIVATGVTASEIQFSDSEVEEVFTQTPTEVIASINAFQSQMTTPLADSFDEPEPLSDELEDAEIRRSKIDAILGFEEENGESFKTENVMRVFAEEVHVSPEITTQTLGDLYYAQGQFEKSLRIFEKLQKRAGSLEISQKIQNCRAQLGVDSVSLKRQQKIDILNAILIKNRNND
ncbi:MAG: tetratricopeptide repeat protein [Bdellovibrionales bacterium]|nr:tetratricopeptide repeat protein [Bdellovibrionales bacterium]